jgi:hypothetical protein
MQQIRTTFNPGVGIAYLIENVKTSIKIKASTLTSRDPDQRPWRSPANTPEGQEFFKMKSGTKKKGFIYYKFMNSNKLEKCLSEDGNWMFSGERTNGTNTKKQSDIKKVEFGDDDCTEITNNIIRSKVEINVDSVIMSDRLIKEKIESISVDDFSSTDQLTDLLSEKENV